MKFSQMEPTETFSLLWFGMHTRNKDHLHCMGFVDPQANLHAVAMFWCFSDVYRDVDKMEWNLLALHSQLVQWKRKY